MLRQELWQISNVVLMMFSSYYNPYRLLIEIYENTEQNDKLLALWQKLETMFPNDPTVKSNIEKYQQLTQPKDTSGN